MPLTPSQYAQALLASLNLPNLPVIKDERSATQLWAQSGGQWLTGYASSPGLRCRAPVASAVQGAWLALQAISDSALGHNSAAHQLIGERAAIAGLGRQGGVSAGGACRFYRAQDGILALNLARPDDLDLLPAWLEQELPTVTDLKPFIATKSCDGLLQRAQLLGLAAARWSPPEQAKVPVNWYSVQHLAVSQVPPRAPRVVDLSSLWAGPLCGALLADCGARVVKVESSQRPDGARFGPSQFYDLLHHNKQSVAVDFKTEVGRHQLRQLLDWADIVIEASRPRALQQLGMDAEALVRSRSEMANQPGKVWLSITGYGRQGPQAEWIAYGDDAGVAAGLAWACTGEQGPPVFCADAVADPLTGIHGALAAWAFWQAGGGVVLDTSLFGVSRYCASFSAAKADDQPQEPTEQNRFTVAEPQARQAKSKAAALGEHTQTVMAEVTSAQASDKG
ncbi:CoA transferase [Halioxenophilus aromaticivorans]|uniref:CoA transferase n=1 Tax=Halioxenophilus aromaticivorans TaxID=1306992 RepID=A0AAV3U3B1_9ALTE